MGYVLLGIAVMNETGFQGAMFQMLAHGISSHMCFFLVGVIYERAHHREINRFGGLWAYNAEIRHAGLDRLFAALVCRDFAGS